MIVHICVGTNDLERATKFYDALAGVLGIGRTFERDKSVGWANPAMGVGFAVTKPFDGNPANFGNGTMASIGAISNEQVDQLHAVALASGGTCEGPPGPRANGFYAAYFRDPDGNKLNCFVMPS
jgi:predicted lactoylglutathione lyase